MAKSITSKFYPNATATCSNCGSVYNLGGDKEKLTLEICGNCHPFYTGNESVIDTSGRIDKFKLRMEAKTPDKKIKTRKNRKQVLSLADLSGDEKPEEDTKEVETKVEPSTQE